MEEIKIRFMNQQDLEAVSELAMLANPHAEKEAYKKHLFEELKENPDLSFVAVTEKGKVVGYVQAETRNLIATLEDIAVKEEYQGKGIGKKLLLKELEALKNKGVKVVFAEVHFKCARAIPFYYKFGFRIAGFMQDYFGIGHDAIVLKLQME